MILTYDSHVRQMAVSDVRFGHPSHSDTVAGVCFGSGQRATPTPTVQYTVHGVHNHCPNPSRKCLSPWTPQSSLTQHLSTTHPYTHIMWSSFKLTVLTRRGFSVGPVLPARLQVVAAAATAAKADDPEEPTEPPTTASPSAAGRVTGLPRMHERANMGLKQWCAEP